MLAAIVAQAKPLPNLLPKSTRSEPVTRIQSPKGEALSQSLGAAMANPATNRVYRLSFAWDYPSGNVVSFSLLFGSTPGVYTNTIWMGRINKYTLSITNWSESKVRHFFVIRVTSLGGGVSPPSNEVHWPPYPPTHIRLSWTNSGPVTIIQSTDLRTWATAAAIVGTNTWTTNMVQGRRFFRLQPVGRLKIVPFNPLN